MIRTRMGASLPIALVALALAGWALFTRPAPPPPAAIPECACDDDALKARIVALTQRLAAAERAIATPRPPPVGEAAPSTAAPSRVALARPAPPTPPEKPRYTRLDPGNPAVRIEQNENGSLRVSNTDPQLTGQVIVVETETEDGVTSQVSVTVPPPE